jgi:hypothetical protein
LTADACDPNCCCDVDCSQADILSTFQGGCLLSNYGNATSSLPFCSQLLLKVNTWQSSDVIPISSPQGLCVVLANSPIKGNFFQGSDVFTSSSSFSERFELAPFPLESTTASVQDVFSQSTSYKYGDAIKINFPLASLTGSLSLPMANPLGLCDHSSPASKFYLKLLFFLKKK